MESVGENEHFFGARTGWASSSGNFVSSDKDKLKLLPEMNHVLLEELRWINQKEAHMQHIAQQAGIDFWNDRYSEDWPEEYKDWYIRTLAWDVMYNKITGLRALGDALKEEGWQPLRPLLLWFRQKNIRRGAVTPEVGPVLNAIDADGCSALHLAAQDGHAGAVRLLKEHGIVDGLPNLAGRCPADLARQHGHAAIAKGLKEGAVSKSNVVPDGIWELVELALQVYSSAQAPSKAELDAAIQHACRETRSGTYMGSTLSFLLEKHGCPAGA